MDIEKLIKLAQNTVITADDIKRLNVDLAQAEKRFEQERRDKERDPQGFLNRQYTV